MLRGTQTMKVFLVRLWTAVAAVAVALTACGGLPEPDPLPSPSGSVADALNPGAHGKPTGRMGGTREHPPAVSPPEVSTALDPSTSSPTGYGIAYHGGPIMTGTVKVYYIFYGNWTGNT